MGFFFIVTLYSLKHITNYFERTNNNGSKSFGHPRPGPDQRYFGWSQGSLRVCVIVCQTNVLFIEYASTGHPQLQPQEQVCLPGCSRGGCNHCVPPIHYWPGV